MRNGTRIILVVVCALAIFLLGVLSRPMLGRMKRHLAGANADAASRAHYDHRSEQHAALQRTRGIVFLGDSRVESGEWAELFDRTDVSNRGISGDTTAGLLRRLPEAVPQDGVLCVLQIGVNDLNRGHSVEDVVANYEKILRYLLKERRARAIVTPIVLMGQEHGTANVRIRERNGKLAKLAGKMGARWVDVNAALAPDGFLSAENTQDGLHFNGKGYLRLRDALAPHLPGSDQ